MQTNISSYIDNSLERVEAKLVSGYEASQLTSDVPRTLKEVNEEYKKVSADLDGTKEKLTEVYALRFVAYIILVVLVAYFKIVTEVSGTVILSISLLAGACWFLVGFMIVRPMEKKIPVLDQRKYRLERNLDQFRLSLEGLENPVGRTMYRYSEETVRENILTYAIQIVDGEKKLDEVRRLKERRVFDMHHLCEFIERRESVMRDAEREAKKFGLEFGRAKLFADAAKHVELSYPKSK